MHVDFGHFFDNLFAVLSLIGILVNLIAIVFVWFYSNYKSYIYTVNVLMFVFILKVSVIQFEEYQSDKKYEKLKLEATISLDKVDNAWKIIDDEKKIIQILNTIEIKKNLYYARELDKKASALYMALASKNLLKTKYYRSKSQEINQNTCSVMKECLTHINIKNETMLLEVFSEITIPKSIRTYNAFDNCIPYSKLDFVKTFLKNKQFKLFSFFIKKQYFDEDDILDILLEFKLIEDADLQKKMMTLLLENYIGVKYEVLFPQKKYKEAFLVNRHTKNRFLQMKKILDDNSSFIQLIPSYIKKHIYKEELTNKESNKYGLYEEYLTYDNGGEYNHSPYSLYIDDEKVDSSLSGYGGYVRYRFNIKDRGEKVLIKYVGNILTDTLEEKEGVAFAYEKKYWIINNEKGK